ncbi:TonB-dependent receptor [Xanthomonas arboricola]|uniref:TonB-dependent receptor n=1 Tax=Xanthomonas TaxID=338 RepID=UPI000CED89AB|nr:MULTISPECIES: TonB-dependent receptor [Xanthomonas]MBB5736459.1 TonB-dependent receptor [Xanthomonas sp. CFBP 8152]PPT79329.1 TonB-dependent receptor [Xanthomonas arboricola]
MQPCVFRSLRAGARLWLPGLAVAMALPAAAQTASAPTELDVIQVSGQDLSIREAIAAKREATVVSDGVAADDIGSIPDFGLGEALQRVPGVSMVMNNGRGEAQFMSLRGLNPDYNTVLIDGVALPATETSRRVQSLDVIPSSLVQRVDVYKSFNADMDSNAIGGIAALRTRSAFDRTGPFATLRGNLAHWQNGRQLDSGGPSGQVQGIFSTTFGDDDRFGLVVSGDYFRRDSSSLNTAVDSYGYYANGMRQPLTPELETSGMAVAPERFRVLTYDNVRERSGAFGKLEYDNRDDLTLSLAAAAFEHRNEEQRRSQFVSRVGNATLLAPDSGAYAQGTAQADANGYDQTRRMRYVQLSGSYRPNDQGRMDAVFNRSSGSYGQDTREDVFTSAASPRLGYTYTLRGTGRPGIALVDPDYYANPANYRQSHFADQVERSSTDNTTIKLDYSQNADADASGWGFRAGLLHRAAEQRYGLDEVRYNPAARATLADIGPDTARICPYADLTCLLLVDPAKARAYFAAHPSAYTLASSNTRNSMMSDFSIEERIGAAYAMGTWRGERTQAALGLRNEFIQRQVVNPMPEPLNSTEHYVQQRTDSANRYLLPSANLAWDLAPRLRLRLSGSRTLGLPTYGDLGQNRVPTIDPAALTISNQIANPTLKPRRSDNLDLSLEWYPDQDAQLSLALFRKRIDDEIMRLTTTSLQTDPAGLIGVYEVTTNQAVNAGQARVNGLELTAIDTRFDFLPGAWSHLGAMVNLTLLDARTADIEMVDGSVRVLPALMESPDRSANVSLLYERGPFRARLSANYTGKQLITAATDNPVNDRYYDAITTYDAQLGWQFTSHLRMTLQGKNLSNARPIRLVGLDQQLLREQLDNGRAFYVGVDYAF